MRSLPCPVSRLQAFAPDTVGAYPVSIQMAVMWPASAAGIMWTIVKCLVTVIGNLLMVSRLLATIVA